MTNITVSELKLRLNQEETLNLLDVREADERAEFNIGGNFLPLGQILALQTDDIEDWKNQEVICYCRSGNRSIQAAMMLESLGFSNVKNLQGGMQSWQENERK